MTSETAVLTDTDAVTQWEGWLEGRRRSVTAPEGFLSLVVTDWSAAGEPAVSDEEARAGHPEHVVLTRQTRADIDSGLPQEGYRIWDADSPAHRAFEGVEHFDYDPDLVIDGRFELVDEERVIPIEHLLDAGATREVPDSGDLVFTRDGVEYRVAVFDTTIAGSPKLHLVFADPTNGVESHGVGRFLFLDRPEADEDALRAGIPVVIDFNRAIVPPCGFSNQANCPLPPLQNRLPFPVRAGESRARYAEGFTL